MYVCVRFRWLLPWRPGNSDPPWPVVNTHSCCLYSLVWRWTQGLQELPVMALIRSVQDEVSASCSEDACVRHWPHWGRTPQCSDTHCHWYVSVCLYVFVYLYLYVCADSGTVSDTVVSDNASISDTATVSDTADWCICAVDYPGLRNAAAIEDLRRNILSAFRAYTTGLSISLPIIYFHMYVDVIRRPSVCRLSVTFVCPTQAIEIFRNVSTPFGMLAICWHPGKILRRSSQGNPSVGGVKHKRGSRI